ncbi:MAG: Sb-PDE family phosphodiesterase [Melioribacteraceae bacterium]
MVRILLILFTTFVFAQNSDSENHRKIIFPDIPGYKTLKCDLHQHTVFSDGKVWPTIRVDEALKDNLDAIAVTEHLEYQPHKNDIPHPDRNRAYEIEKKAASEEDLIIISGAEITRNMPPGHSNAIFIDDANKLLIEDSLQVFYEAKKQDAFIFWNHPDWTRQKKDAVAELTDMHKMLIQKGMLNGIEVVNGWGFSDEALQIALDNNLTIMGTSDIHGLIDWEYEVHKGGHRPVTLVFTKEKSVTGIKDGLNNRRTVVFSKNYLIGRDEFLVPLINASIVTKEIKYRNDSFVLEVILKNLSSTEFTLKNTSKYKFHNASDLIKIESNAQTKLMIKTLEELNEVLLTFQVLNAINAPNSHPEISLSIKVD